MRRAFAIALFLAACDKTRAPELPPAQVYEQAVAISGSWHGEVGGVSGELRVQKLDALRYYGMFEATATGRKYVLSMRQVEAPAPSGGVAPSNLVQFTWQDGHGDRGAGWLLVNREGSALTGSYGRGEGNTDGAGAWTFVKKPGEELDVEVDAKVDADVGS